MLYFLIVILISAGAMPIASLAQSDAERAVVIVNGAPILNKQISQKMRLLFLLETNVATPIPSAKVPFYRKVALDDLIEETLKSQELKRRGIALETITEEAAFERIARDRNLSVGELHAMLDRRGIPQSEVGAIGRIEVAWRNIQSKLVNTNAAAGVPQSVAKMEIAQRRIVIAATKPSQQELAQNLTMAEALRKRAMQEKLTCSTLDKLREGGRDVVIDRLMRLLDTSYPEPLRSLLLSTGMNEITVPMPGALGIEMFMVCNKADVVVSGETNAGVLKLDQEREILLLARRSLYELRREAEIIAGANNVANGID